MTRCFCNCCKKLLTMPFPALVILAVGVGSLLFAFIQQYGFDVQPCILCYWQRVPYGLAIILGGLAFLSRGNEAHARAILGLCGIVFLVSMGLGIFHTGVEQHWWLGTDGCRLQPLHADSVTSLREKLLEATAVPCDQIQWMFLGLSMANWNILASLALAVFAFLAALGRCNPPTEGAACCCCRKPKN
jgi:disulfide bond formation protein DsbB